MSASPPAPSAAWSSADGLPAGGAPDVLDDEPAPRSARHRRTRRLGWPLAGPDRNWSLVVVLAVAGLYSVTLTSTYGLYDDYRLTMRPQRLLRLYSADGRPLTGLIQSFAFNHADRVVEFVWMRAVTVTLLGACAAALFMLLRRAELPAAGAAALVVCAAASVAIQVIAAWGVALMVAPPALLLGGASGHLVWRAVRLPGEPDRLSARLLRASLDLRRALLGALCLVLALSLYQPAAMAFWLTVLVTQATQPMRAGVRLLRCVRLGVVAGVAYAAYLVVWRISVAAAGQNGSRSELATRPLDKLDWFLNSAMVRAFHPYSLGSSLSRSLAIGVAAIALLGIALRYREGNLLDRLTGLVACIACFPLAYMPNLAVAEDWASARTLLVLMPMAVVITGIGVHGLVGSAARATSRRPAVVARRTNVLWSAALCVASVPLFLHAQSTVLHYLVNSNAQELAAFQAAVRVAAAQDPAEIVLVPANYQDTNAPGVSFDEFGWPASTHGEALVAMANDALWGRQYHGTLRVVPRAELATVAAGAVVIDTSQVLKAIQMPPAGDRS